MSIHVFGIRHHGPGCARGLRTALEALKPDIVLVEGPPDAQEILPILRQEGMQPPVALLIYPLDRPEQAVYYPFTIFSPEWQALNYALQCGIPARFMDLPQAIQLAKMREELPIEKQTGDTPLQTASVGKTTEAEPPPEVPIDMAQRDDPLAILAKAAGYSDYELWWEQQIEQRHDNIHLFEGILEAMTALRSNVAPRDEEEAQREAHMRQTIRATQKAGFQRIAIICGAWHAPVLVDMAAEKADAALLNGLKKIKVEATWIPWTNSRLSYRSGYGAGVTSPGWYEHLWTAPDRITIRWIARAAQLLRSQDLNASSASVIEAVRLSESLAAMRDLPMPGLDELRESIQTVLCHGSSAPMDLIRNRLEIGEKLGAVPPTAPAVPLQRDLEAKQRKLRMAPSAEITMLELDLRKEIDHTRSQLLHQLRLLNIPWGKLQHVHGKAGTFHEHWQIQWQVEFTVALIEANVWGNTLETAAATFVCQTADHTEDLPKLTNLLDGVILAELPEAVNHLLQTIEKRAAISADVQHLMNAMPPLARVARYSDVRQTKAERIMPVIDSLFERVIIALPGACASLDDDAAQAMVNSTDRVQESVSLLNQKGQRTEWHHLLRQLMGRENIHGFVRGRCCRLLLEQNELNEEELQKLTRLALSLVTPAPQAAAWIEGVLRGSGLLVLHQDGLWQALNHWLSELTPDTFEALLPILRRAFAGFQAPERRQMGEKVKHLSASSATMLAPHLRATHDKEMKQNAIQRERADRVLPVLAQIIGVTFDGN